MTELIKKLVPGITTIFVAARSRTTVEEWINLQGDVNIECRHVWAEDTISRIPPQTSLLVFLQEPQDPLSWKEMIGRQKIFFPHHMIIKVYKDIKYPQPRM